jgi:tetratricopeptide (TPR) repeat protein
MIELLLVADRLLAEGSLDSAEKIYAQVVGADSHNAIAIVGLARVARARGDFAAALALGRQALAIDPEDLVAQRLIAEVEAAAPDPDATVPDPDAPATTSPPQRSGTQDLEPEVDPPHLWTRIRRLFRLEP